MIFWQKDQADILMLNGEWAFALGEQSGVIDVPGTWEAAGYSRHIDGPATYTRLINVPAAWSGQTIHIQFRAVSYHAHVSINDQYVGEHSGLWTPFEFDVTDHIRAGESNVIRIDVYKPGETYPMRESLAGFLPDVATTFGGLWGAVQLVALPQARFSRLKLKTDTERGELFIQGDIDGTSVKTVDITIQAPDGTTCADVTAPVENEYFRATLQLTSPQHWHPQTPYLYTLQCTIQTDDQTQHLTRQFGFRTLACDGEQVLFNGEPIFLRGVLNWGWYPEILCPAPDEATIRDEFRRVRELGYNMIKLCLYVPSPLYFEIADEEGMLLWLELPMWLPHVTPRLRQQAHIEYADILEQVHHHPSIVIYSLGCELGHSVDSNLLGELDHLLRDCVSDVIACDNSGSGEAYGGLSFDYADFNDYHFYCDLHYFMPLVDHFRREWRSPRPWIFGEFCDADDYRDLNPIIDHYGGELPWWFVEKNPIHAVEKLAYFEQQARMEVLDLGFDDAALQAISRKQSFVIRKSILEKVRSRSGMGGYVVTGLRDTPLVSSAMFDELGQSKYPIEAFRNFNDDTVLVLEQGRARLWTHGGDRPDPIDLFNRLSGEPVDLRLIVSHAGVERTEVSSKWRVIGADGEQIEREQLEIPSLLPSYIPREITRIAFTAPTIEQPQVMTLEAELGELCRNRWQFWVYPQVKWLDTLQVYDPAGTLAGLDDLLDAADRIYQMPDDNVITGNVLISGVFDDNLVKFVERGGRALILQTGDGNLPVRPCPFWREAINLIYDHPVFETFPHDGFTDLQFYHLAGDHALDVDALKQRLPQATIRPILRRLDARLFTTLDYMMDIELGKGKMICSTLHFTGNTGDQTPGLHANVAGRYLLHRLLTELAGSG